LLARGIILEQAVIEAAIHEDMERFRRSGEWISTREQEQVFWLTHYRNVLTTLGIDDTGDSLVEYLIRKTMYVYWSEPFPEAHAVLQAVQGHVRLGVISNAWPSMQEVLDRLGLTPYFDAITLSCAVGVSKPDPRIYQAALEALDVTPTEAAFVDDNEDNVLAAMELGFTAFLLDRNDAHPDSPCRRVQDLWEYVEEIWTSGRP